MNYSPLLSALIEHLRCLPGVGPKSAQRMAFHLLERDRSGALELSRSLSAAVEKVGHCRSCRMLTEQDLCQICAAPKRDQSALCVVETPADVVAAEQSAGFNGRYFVLMGHLSPLDGVGPAGLGIDLLFSNADEGEVREIVLATNPTVEGEATAHYIADLASQRGVAATRIAHGVPIGGEIRHGDRGTSSPASAGRLPPHQQSA